MKNDFKKGDDIICTHQDGTVSVGMLGKVLQAHKYSDLVPCLFYRLDDGNDCNGRLSGSDSCKGRFMSPCHIRRYPNWKEKLMGGQHEQH